ncbi:DNA cytosine methyltransferase [Ruegeria marisrubri]|uniref:DNA cytosine methyltransferase n=1 Tax=Ruegeria marisrubri TaxID=1685379 RepID=UPI001CD51577|nr:DNA cytosine methyltransferase [Ruegeria marisrubri]MCA0907108.1 DNA cytosine methyltransferase [Ruegeria marisrubri]
MADLRYNSIDLFAGCGGLTEGMRKAGFQTKVAVELEAEPARAFRLNHPEASLIEQDIRTIDISEVKRMLGGAPLHLLAGCPPCQGFSSVRKLNKKASVRDPRNQLVVEYFRFVEELKPLTLMMENVPGLADYYLFKQIVKKLKAMGYWIDVQVVNVKNYGVPQSRRRLVMVGSRLGAISVAEGFEEETTVRDAISHLPTPEDTTDPIHKIVAKHSDAIKKRISLTPKDGGSRKDLPAEYTLDCHKDEKIGFNDVYGRLRWDTISTTITGGCLNPSKGRFLHPEQNRAITPREAALLQSFPEDYVFPADVRKQSLALMIGNALPPAFSFAQSANIASHLSEVEQIPG